MMVFLDYGITEVQAESAASAQGLVEYHIAIVIEGSCVVRTYPHAAVAVDAFILDEAHMSAMELILGRQIFMHHAAYIIKAAVVVRIQIFLNTVFQSFPCFTEIQIF